MSQNQDEDRRGFLATISTAVSGVIAMVAAIPGLGTLIHPLIDDTVAVDLEQSLLGNVSDFAENTPKRVMVSAHQRDGWVTTPSMTVGSVWVVKKGNDFLVLSSVCPHRGCPISSDSKGFVCPCHSSYFDVAGVRTESEEPSPSPRDMDVLEHSVSEGKLYCKYQRFKSGTAEKTLV